MSRCATFASLQLFRVSDEGHPIWDGTGAAMLGGRWNSPGRPVIYCSLSYSCAMLEILVPAGIGRLPTTQGFVVANVPDDMPAEKWPESTLPEDWNREGSASARALGDRWLLEATSALLIVPSAVAPLDWNALVNPLHPDARRLIPSDPKPVAWDQRLFQRR